MTESACPPSPSGPTPTPFEVARRVGAGQVRRLECLACERRTDHVPGPATQGRDGALLVQWWRCVECPEGRTVG